MYTCASNYELVEPLPKLERTLNRRLRRQNRRDPFDQRNNPPQHPRIVYSPILNIYYFLDILQNYDPVDDEPMWATDRVVALTPGSAITIPKTVNEFAIKAGDIFLYNTPNQAYQLLKDKVVLNLDWAKNKKTKPSFKKTVAFTDEGSSNSDSDKVMARMDAMTIKMNAHYKELQSRAKQSTPDLDDDDMPMSREKEAIFMQTFCKTRFYNDYRSRDSNRDNWRSNGWNNFNRDNYRSNTNDKPYDLEKTIQRFHEISAINQRLC
nr:hypothetical protein [Tanacetum cinerariifolium]